MRNNHSITEDIAETIYDEETIQKRIAELGRRISQDYAGKNPLLVGVLSGVVLFMADLLRYITIPVTVDFMAISHYQPKAESGSVRITKDLDHAISGRHVLFVEDVIDTGLTLNYLLRTLSTRHPASLEVCVLFDRPYRRLIDIPLAYHGMELPDRFVVGYGLDAGGLYRNLPYIGVLKEDVEIPRE
ncbi:MAG: hypoxanthine phosphoribosyltransferase [Chloroflexota bacterium]|nr:hypoxanthine phosphoribosyltransferase [Chloroflexota bacterium]